VEPLIKVLVDKRNYSSNVEYWEWEASTRIDNIEQHLIDKYKKEADTFICYTCCVVLGEIGDERAVGSLIKALEDEDCHPRMAAAEALGRIGDNRAVEPLIKALEDDEVRYAAEEALEKLGHEVE
jgi:HEAT repeat protein